MNRAYSQFTVKAVDEDARTIEGIATTPKTDRVGDIVEPEGAAFTLPIPLLWQHDSRAPIGHVNTAKVSKDGISIKAQLVQISEPGTLKDRLDEAWQSIKSGLVRGLSIGFRPLKSENIDDDNESYFAPQRFLEWDWLELSAVTIPANADASITSIKSADEPFLRAATGAHRVVRLDQSPGASGATRKGVVYLRK